MSLKVKKVAYVGKAAREKNKERVRTFKLPEKRIRIEGDLTPEIFLPALTVYRDETVGKITVPDFDYPIILGDIFTGIYIDSNYRIIFTSKEVDRYKCCISDLLSIYVEIDSLNYKLIREKGFKSYVPLFVKVDIGSEFIAQINPLFGMIVYDGKLTIIRRDKKQSRYSIRLENLLRKYKSGRVDFKLSNLVYELGASSMYAKSFGQFYGRVLAEAIETVNTNDRGVYIKDFDSADDVVWFEIEIS